MEESSKKRPFFSSIDDMLEDEYYDEHLTEKKRRLNPEQVHMLERSFEKENKLEPEKKTELAKKLGLQPRQVAVWFQNRRARWKTKTLERDYGILKSSYDILKSDYECVGKEIEMLKAQIASLNEKLQSKGTSTMNEEITWSATEEGGHVKVEDHVSTGSAVVDDQEGPQLLVDSGDSYFPDVDNPHEYQVVPPVDQFKEDADINDADHNRFQYAFEITYHHHLGEDDALGWIWA